MAMDREIQSVPAHAAPEANRNRKVCPGIQKVEDQIALVLMLFRPNGGLTPTLVAGDQAAARRHHPVVAPAHD